MRGIVPVRLRARTFGVLVELGVVIAFLGLAGLPAMAHAQGRTIPASATVQARPAPARPPAGAEPRGPRVIPLRVRNPAGLAAAKRAAATRARPGSARSSAAFGRNSVGSQIAAFGPRAAVFANLNTPGLSAAQQIAAFGASNDVTPPDTTGAIGPNHYVEIVNSEIAVYSRSNLALVGSPVDLAAFTGGTSPCDPQVKYDPQTQRWFYVALRCDQPNPTSNEFYVGWSKTSDPSSLSSSGWCTFTVASSPATSIDDYPKLGVDSTHIIIGSNLFNATTGSFQTAHIQVAAKPSSGTTCPTTAPTFTVFGAPVPPTSVLKTSSGNVAFTPEPATISETSSTTGYVVAADQNDSNGTGSNLMVWQIGGTATSPTMTPKGDIPVPGFAPPPNAPQPGTTDRVDTSDGRLTQAVAAADPNAGGGEGVWTQHTIDNGSGGSVDRWYELIPSTMTLRQSGTIGDASGFAFNGAVAPTLNGGAVINYNTGGASQRVAIKAQSRIPSAPPNVMTMPITLAGSSDIDADLSCPSQLPIPPSTSCRWGDYAGASVDPSNRDLVWGSNQINGPQAGGSSQWATQNFALVPNEPPPTASFTATKPAIARSPAHFNAGSSSSHDGTITSYSWNFGDGKTGTGVTSSHTYSSRGAYKVTLVVRDNFGQSATTSQTLVVHPKLKARLRIAKRQKLSAVLKHGLIVVLSPNVRVFVSGLGRTRVNGRRVKLFQVRHKRVKAGKHRFKLKRRSVAVKKVAGRPKLKITVRLTLIDDLGQRKTVTATATLQG